MLVARICLSLLMLAVLSAQTQAGLVNGGFESGNFSGWTVLGAGTIQNSTFGSGPTEGNFQALIATEGERGQQFSAAEIEEFVGMNAGTLSGLGTATSGGVFKQTITANAGDVLSFDWNFLTNEPSSSRFNDFGFWALINAETGEVLSDTFGDFVTSSTLFARETGFQSQSFTLPSSGSFTLAFGVVNGSDSAVLSGLLVDNVNLAVHSPEPSTLALCGLGISGLVVGALRRRKQVPA